MTSASERLHGLDAVRGYALMLGVVFHATMAFLPGQQVWLLKDEVSSPTLAGLFFVTHIFRMSTFFLIAGFFARMNVHRRGARGFVIDRARRIVLPLIVFWPLMICAITLASGYDDYVATGVFPTKPPAPPPGVRFAFPLTHLWFLYVLTLLYVGALTGRWAVARMDRDGRLRSGVDRIVADLLKTPASPALLAVPVAAAFYATPWWLTFFGVPTPDMSLVPSPPATVQYGLAFGLGWLLHRQPALFGRLQAFWPLNLTVAVTTTSLLVAHIGLVPGLRPDPPGIAKAFHAGAYGLAIWTWSFAAIGLAMRFLRGHSPSRRYIADASYWIYLIHMPVVLALQAWVSGFDWPWPAKFGAVVGIGFALMFASYELLARHTFLGAWLNGRRVPWRAPRLAVQPESV